jgi:MFS transporter, DHA3 family, multidrug efflux protein
MPGPKDGPTGTVESMSGSEVERGQQDPAGPPTGTPGDPASRPSSTGRIFTAAFLHVLVNTLVVAVIDFTVWFAITFFVFLETRSVLATGMVAGVYLLFNVSTGIWFGSLVDHHRKKTVMLVSTAVSFVFYLISFGIERGTDAESFRSASSPQLWLMVLALMLGVISGNLRFIALPTLVTLLIPASRRDRANGLVGSATGVSFLVTSVISGFLVAAGGMFYVLLLGMAVNLLAMAHLWFVKIEGDRVAATDAADKGVDLRGTYRLARATPGLLALVAFSTFNNLLNGVFMALMDAYGLSMVSVQAWGLLWGVLSTGFILGGLVIARVGLGSNPVRTLLLCNVVIWSVTVIFPLQASVILLAGGMFTYLCLMPAAEAAEQTILQRVVPFERQGRVFGFAQSIEQMAAPMTAFLIGPIAEWVFIPYMTDGAGARLIGGWFGTGQARGIAFLFVLTAVIGLAMTVFALRSKSYRRLSDVYRASVANDEAEDLVGSPGA